MRLRLAILMLFVGSFTSCPAEEPRGAALPEAQRLLKAAEDGWAAAQKTMNVGNVPMTPETIHLWIQWPRRVYEAQSIVRPDHLDRVKAADAYLGQVKMILKAAEGRMGQDVLTTDLSEIRYEIARADYELVLLKSEGNVKGR
jgi:hypothetical protein